MTEGGLRSQKREHSRCIVSAQSLHSQYTISAYPLLIPCVSLAEGIAIETSKTGRTQNENRKETGRKYGENTERRRL